jgi:hypothetical protein
MGGLIVTKKIKKLDFCYENLLVKVIADSDHPKIKLAGLSVGPFKEGDEYEVHYWVAKELVNSHIVHFRNEDLDSTKLYKIQWRERNQMAGQISKLPDGFYPKLRRYLIKSKDELSLHPEKVREYDKSKDLAWDIVNSRLKKIVALSSGPNQTNFILKKLANEERFICQELGRIINNWKDHILNLKGAN